MFNPINEQNVSLSAVIRRKINIHLEMNYIYQNDGNLKQLKVLID